MITNYVSPTAQANLNREFDTVHVVKY
jgi:hypothetical protein